MLRRGPNGSRMKVTGGWSGGPELLPQERIAESRAVVVSRFEITVRACFR